MPNNPFGSFEDAFEQGISQVKQSVKQQVVASAQNVATQTTGSNLGIGSDATGGAQPPSPDGGKALTDQFNETAAGTQQQNSQSQDPQMSPTDLAQIDQKSQEDQQKKLEEARKKLQAHQQQHKTTYFDPTFNRPRQEPTVQEKLEQEKQEEEQKKMVELEEKKKKDEPIALSRAKRTAEMNRGASG